MLGFLKKSVTDSAPAGKPSWTERLKQGLSRTRAQLGAQLSGVFSRGKIDDALLEELETTLLMADVGVAATQHCSPNLERASNASASRPVSNCSRR